MTSSHLLNKDTISNVDTSLTNTDLSNLSNTGESHFQTPLVSGNNIKTINSTSLLGSGDITISAGAPTGSIMIWAGTTVPEGYLLCDGSAVSRTTYNALFSAIGTTYGAGDSSTTFNLPDFTNRVIQGNGTGYVNAGLPSISHSHYIAKCSDRGTLGQWYASAGRLIDIVNYGTSYSIYTSGIAQTLSSIYGASTTVQPPACKAYMIIRY